MRGKMEVGFAAVEDAGFIGGYYVAGHRARGICNAWMCATGACSGIALGVHREDGSFQYDVESAGIQETRPINAAVKFLVGCGENDSCS